MDYTTADDWYQTVDAPAQAPASPLWAERPNENASLLAQRYEIKGLLGAGGAGSVFRARDLVLGEDVALKVLKRVHPHPTEAVEDLRNEVRLARRVTHRSIARVYDLVEHDGVYFLTMEFIDGISLAKRLGRGRS
ncbi:MAG TPA: protein kinase, partial [Pseudomonadota bacterium]|nr:protein kinase [Pseudomonadota bacterium]